MSAQQEGNEASAEEGAAAAVVRPDQYQQVRSGSNARFLPSTAKFYFGQYLLST